MKVAAIIPARYGSTRFPGKVLFEIQGKPMIQWVFERAGLCQQVEEVIVATDDERVREVVEGFGGRVMMTSPNHPSGTDRLAEAAEKLTAQIIINIQGDEPLIHPETISLVIDPLLSNEPLSMTSVKIPIENYEDFLNPNVVKTICDEQDMAIYFSRSPLPYYRDSQDLLSQWKKFGRRPPELMPVPMKHIGIYGYRTAFLTAITKLPVTALEQAERLEQLRALSWGFKIKVPTTPHDSIGVDVPEDVEKVARRIKQLNL